MPQGAAGAHPVVCSAEIEERRSPLLQRRQNPVVVAGERTFIWLEYLC